jgi:hypothetical protein
MVGEVFCGRWKTRELWFFACKLGRERRGKEGCCQAEWMVVNIPSQDEDAVVLMEGLIWLVFCYCWWGEGKSGLHGS